MQPAFHLKDDAKLTLSHQTPKIPKKFRPPNGGIKENPAAIASYIFARYEKISKNDVCFRGLRPVFVFSYYSICGSSSKKQRGDEQLAFVAEAARYAAEADAPAFAPVCTLPPAARTRKPVCVAAFVQKWSQ